MAAESRGETAWVGISGQRGRLCHAHPLRFECLARQAQALLLQEIEHRDSQRLTEMALQRGRRGVHVARDLLDAQGLRRMAPQPVRQVDHAPTQHGRRRLGHLAGLRALVRQRFDDQFDGAAFEIKAGHVPGQRRRAQQLLGQQAGARRRAPAARGQMRGKRPGLAQRFSQPLPVHANTDTARRFTAGHHPPAFLGFAQRHHARVRALPTRQPQGAAPVADVDAAIKHQHDP